MAVFFRGLPRNPRVPREASRGSAETNRNCLGQNLRPQFYGFVVISLFCSCIGLHEQHKHLSKVLLQQTGWKTLLCGNSLWYVFAVKFPYFTESLWLEIDRYMGLADIIDPYEGFAYILVLAKTAGLIGLCSHWRKTVIFLTYADNPHKKAQQSKSRELSCSNASKQTRWTMEHALAVAVETKTSLLIRLIKSHSKISNLPICENL